MSMINIFVGYELSNRYKRLRDQLPNRTTDSEFMDLLLKIWQLNYEELNGHTQRRNESISLGIQANINERGSEIKIKDESDIHTDKKSVPRGTQKQTKRNTNRRPRDGGESV